jgi:uncharacterized membrane-anchored protein
VPDADASVNEAAGHWQRAALQPGLSPTERLHHVSQGLAAVDRALDVDPRSLDALAFRYLLLRLAADLETDAAARAVLRRDAEQARTRAAARQDALSAGFD